MQFTNNYLISLPLIALFIALFLMLGVRRYRSKPIATTFLVLMSALAWWSLTVVSEHASSDLPAKIFWIKMSYFGIVTLPPAWVVFTLQYANKEKWLTRRNLAMLIIMPVITLVMVWTNDIYHLMWKDIWLDTSLSPPVDAVTHNIGFWVQAVYAYLLLLSGTLILFGMFLRSSGIYRKQVGTMLLASMVPWVGNLLFIAEVGPFSVVDPTPLAFTITGIVFWWGLFRFRILDIMPIAHEAIFKNMTDGVIVVDAQSRITDINPAAERILGLKRANTIGQPYSLVSQGQTDLTELEPDISGTPSVISIREGQTLRYYVAHVSPINMRNHVGGHLVLLHDDTERRKAEAEGMERVRLETELIERKRAEDLFRTLANSSPVGIYIVQNSKFCYVNPSFQSFTGYREDELLGRDSLELVFTEDRNMVRENAIKMLKGKLSSPYQFRVIHKNGGSRWVMESVSSVQYRGRRATLGSYMDITERKRIEEVLQAEKNKLQSLIDAMEDDLTIQDRDFNIIYQNEPSRISTGGDYAGEKCYRVYEGKEKVCHGCPVEKAFRDGRSHTAERRRVTSSGEVIFFENTANPIRDAEGEIVACLEIGRNITERKRTDEQLRQSEGKYSTLVERSNDGVVVIQNGLLVFANSRITDITGFSLEETQGKPFVDFISPEYIESVVESYKKRMAGEETSNRYEMAILAKDGRKIPVEINASRIEYEGKAADMAIIRDITERKQIEERLRENEKLFSTVFNSAPVGIANSSPEGKFLQCNRRFHEILGYDEQELLGKSFKDITHPSDLSESIRLVGEIHEGKRDSFRVEKRYRAKDGHIVWASVAVSGVRDGKGELQYHIVTLADITERKRAEAALRESEQRYRMLIENVPQKIFYKDKNLVYISCNNNYARDLKIKPDEIAGKTDYDFFPKKLAEKYRTDDRKIIDSEKIEAIEEKYVEDGREKIVETFKTPVRDEKGNVAGVLGIFHDITERKRMQEQLMLTDRLSSIGELASGIAHELNNPLTSVIGFSQLLLGRDIPDDMKEDLSLVNSEAQRAAGIVKNLLTFARKHAAVKQLSQINNIIEDVLRLRAYEQKVNNIEVERHFAPNLPEIMVDYFQMQQVFLNIIINAEYFMIQAHNKGTLIITTERLDSIVRISFTDDGPGISKENLKRLFNPFFTTKEVGKGTGLGLSICHGIVAEHGGRIYARSQPGKGASFVVELPLKVTEEVYHGEVRTLTGKALS